MVDLRVYLFEDDEKIIHVVPGDTNFGITVISLCGIQRKKLKNFNLPGDPPFSLQGILTMDLPKSYKKCPTCFKS